MFGQVGFINWDEIEPDNKQRIFWLLARMQLERKEYECIRVDGWQVCKWCKKPYNDHPQLEPELIPTLVIDCEGRRLKT